MTVTSLEWLLWLLSTTTVFWLLPSRFRDLFLMTASLSFLAVYDLQSAAVLIAFTGISFFGMHTPRLSGQRVLLISMTLVLVLVYYKLRLVTGRDDFLGAIAIPLGISYYTFRCLHFVLERYKGRLAQPSLRNYSCYLLFMPTILAGPIHRFPDFQRDLSRCRWNSGLFAEGLERILYGYVKIMVLAVFVLAEQFGAQIDALQVTQPQLATYLLIIQRSLHGYLLFAGYSDIAIGFARLLGFRVMENFHWPFLARNISQFWQSWHISLSTWIREYLYASLFATTRNAVFAAIASMVVFGLWHELSWRYVLWGAYHGVGIAIWQQFQSFKVERTFASQSFAGRMASTTSTVITFHFVVFGFVIVHEPTLAATAARFATLLGW